MKKKEEIDFRELFKNKRIPLLTLDKRWHDLFANYDKTAEIKKSEAVLNKLIRKQGKLADDIKEMQKLKKTLMDGIVNNMGATLEIEPSVNTRRMDKSQKLIKEINEKVKINDIELDNMPDEIKRANEKLVVASMNACYQKLYENSEEIKELTEWIDKVRLELKEKILRRTDLESDNTYIYSYVHNLLGVEVIQILDDKIGKQYLMGNEK